MKTELKEAALIKWGMNAQLDMLNEECLECALAVNNYKRRKKDSFTKLLEEMADVEIMLEQIKHILCIGGDKFEFRTQKAKKIKRLKERLNK